MLIRQRLVINANIINQAGPEAAGFSVLAGPDVQPASVIKTGQCRFIDSDFLFVHAELAVGLELKAKFYSGQINLTVGKYVPYLRQPT